MFKELVASGRDLEDAGKLPPQGFYDYGEPIRWVVHLLPDGVHLEAAELNVARPYSGRTSAVEEHLLADEACYALGVSQKREGGEDTRAAEKHRHFRTLVDAFLASSELADRGLRESIAWLEWALENRWIVDDARYSQIGSKDWVSFVPGQGPLSGMHLFAHPQAKAFWVRDMERRCTRDDGKGTSVPVGGTCAVCGKETKGLVRKLPLGVKLAGTVPLHSLNADAFTSFVGGASTADKAHLGVCFGCGDTAARAFNFLRASKQHCRTIVRDQRKRDGLGNQIALFWLKAPAPVRVAETVIDLSDLDAIDLGAVLGDAAGTPRAELSQLLALLEQPWKPTDVAFRLDDYGFYLGVLSPNVGRIAVREWIAVSLAKVKANLAAFLDGTRMVSVWGDAARPVSVRSMVEAIGTGNPNLTGALLRSAYSGTRPPASLAGQAGRRLNHLIANEASLRDRQRGRGTERAPVWNDGWPQALAAAIKLGLFYGTKEMEGMDQVNPLFRSKGYHCGRLLAVLEEAQQRYHYRRYGGRLETTIVNRSYGGASSAPKATFAPLWRLATTSHLPEAGGQINQEVEAIVATLVELGGMPETLLLADQADFGLGFYHQRAAFRASRSSSERAQEGEPEPEAE